ncbi:hypothetical protein E2C01_010487 [Portunus trituberculatus]|uniref:Uncharacterized protein n=1 Tax=Portunus trituberculatus TaxID=210409 RepID=A0A5B7D8L9_PORTR|nr:hypothetical protein [Portunus trituberculatus]
MCSSHGTTLCSVAVSWASSSVTATRTGSSTDMSSFITAWVVSPRAGLSSGRGPARLISVRMLHTPSTMARVCSHDC